MSEHTQELTLILYEVTKLRYELEEDNESPAAAPGTDERSRQRADSRDLPADEAGGHRSIEEAERVVRANNDTLADIRNSGRNRDSRVSRLIRERSGASE